MSIGEFADKLNDVMPVMLKEFSRRQTNDIYKGKITLPQFLILSFLYNNGDSNMSGIARYMSVTTAAMTGMVDRLERYGYVKRGHEPDDRRIININLTAKGKDLVEKINTQRREMIVDVFGKVSEQDRSDYLRVLMRVKNILTRAAL